MTVPLAPYDLRTEHRDAPLGIDALAPRFSWRLRGGGRGAAQAAFRIVVTARGEVAWDSGRIGSSRTTGIEFGGALASRTRYEWTLEVFDEHGTKAEPVSSWFETGLLDPADYRGAWIGRDINWDAPDEVTDPPIEDDVPDSVRQIPPAPHLRKEFGLPAPVVRARAYASARGLYRLHLNGERVGDAELTPGWTDYTDRVLYQTYDVTDLLRAGENAVGIALADGWWSGYVGFDARRQGNHYGTDPQAWAMIVAEHADGTETVIATDGSWRESRGDIVYTDMLMGECVDRRRDLGEWTRPGYDDSGWASAVEVAADHGVLAAQVDEPIRVTEERPAVERRQDPDGKWIYDFGQNLVGRVRLALDGLAAGQQVVLRHGEVLDDDGRLYTDNLRAAEQRDVFISAGTGGDVFEPAFTLHGFRYLEVSGTGAPPAPSDVTAVVLHNDTPFTGEITTSSDDVNQLISNIRWGQRGNFAGVPTDCPQRDERLGWMADAQVFLPTAALNADVASFFTRWLHDVRFAQSEEGSFRNVAPVISRLFQRDGAPAWADAGVIIPWHLYRVYGDRRLLEQSYPSMARFVDFLERNNPDLIWKRRTGPSYGDWLQVDANTPRDVLATAYFGRSAALVAQAAATLGNDTDAERFSALAERIRAAFREAFVAGDGRIHGDTQTVYLLALAFGLVEGPARAQAADHLVRTIAEHDGLLTTGFVGVSLLCPVLTDIGRADLAFDLLETDRYPSWLYSVRHGATTIWERWDGWTEHAGFQAVQMNSFNHYSLGSVGEWLYRHVAGIDQLPESTGYDRPLIAPHIGGSLSRVSAGYETPRGRIETEWTRDGERAELSVTIPPGATAEVVLPGTEATEGGTALDGAEGISGVRPAERSTALTAESGDYRFVFRLA